MENTVEGLKKTLEQSQKTLSEDNDKIFNLEREKAALNDQLTKNKTEKDALQAELENKIQEKQTLENEKKQLNDQVIATTSEINKKSKQIDRNNEQIEDLNKQLTEKDSINKAALEKEKETLQVTNENFKREREEMQEENTRTKERIVTLVSEFTRLNDEIKSKDENLEQAVKSLSMLTDSNNTHAGNLAREKEKHTKAQKHIMEKQQVIQSLMDAIRNQKNEIQNLKGNTGDLVFEDSFGEFFKIIDFKEGNQPLYTNKPLKNTFKPRDDLWLFNDKNYKHFKNDKQNYQLIELYKLREEIGKFRLKPYKLTRTNPYDVIFRAYLYNKLIAKLNDFLEKVFPNGELSIKFSPIEKFEQKAFTDLGGKKIPELAKSPLFKNWKKPDQIQFSEEQEAFLKILKKNLQGPTYEIKRYENMRKDFMDKVFCPVFHSAKYINRTYPIIDKFIKHINGGETVDVKDLNDDIELKIVEHLKLDSADKNFTTIVHIKFNGGRKFGGGARAMRGGSRYMNFKLSSRSVERIQNVSYYNIVKTIRWRYYVSRKKTEESIEVTIFKDYLFTLISCVFLLAAGNDKLAYGTFIDQLLSIGLFYEFDQDLTALLLPYYLPFT